jgi:hypothetical protein
MAKVNSKTMAKISDLQSKKFDMIYSCIQADVEKLWRKSVAKNEKNRERRVVKDVTRYCLRWRRN